ncbi:MAG TPA: hypothetical protein VJ227_05015 [Patescibacteria group bacterium]|nr:hypothetical protein [Patescibacteria group bacterium]
MNSILLNCSNCKKSFYRDIRHVNEGAKFGWKHFCSKRCMALSKTTAKKFVCFRPGCNREFIRAPSARMKSSKFYCSTRCAAMINNLTRKKKVRICPTCGNEFSDIRIYCSSGCIPKRGSKYTKLIVIAQIKNFHKIHDRIPIKREMYGLYRVARKYFGTWNTAIRKAGFKPNPVMFAHKYIAKDGDRCDSLAEKMIDDYLFARKIKHIRNFPYPGGEDLTVDFKIGRFWLEFFGLSGQLRKYDRLKRRKQKLAKKFKLNLIEILPGDITPDFNLDRKLYSLL